MEKLENKDKLGYARGCLLTYKTNGREGARRKLRRVRRTEREKEKKGIEKGKRLENKVGKEEVQRGM